MVVLIQKVVKEGGIKNSGKTGDVIYGQAMVFCYHNCSNVL